MMFLIFKNTSYIYRILKENIILAGLWYGDAKPDMSVFWEPLSITLNNLYHTGVCVRNCHCNNMQIYTCINSVNRHNCECPWSGPFYLPCNFVYTLTSQYYSVLLYMTHQIYECRDTIMMLLALIDRTGSICRIRHRLQRCVYHSEVV